MTRRRLLAATMIALSVAISPVAGDAGAVLGVGLSSASCEQGDCGYWNPMIDCFCPDLQIPQHWPRCGAPDGP